MVDFKYDKKQGDKSQDKKDKKMRGVGLPISPCDLSSDAPFILMDENGTYILLYRKLQNTSFYKDSYALHLAIHCLLKAGRFPKQVTVGNQVINLERGQFITGRHTLYLETGIKESTIRNKLSLLSKVGFLDIKTTTKYSIITIKNYDKYQLKKEIRTAEEPTDGQQNATKKKDKKEKKENNNINSNTPPPSPSSTSASKDEEFISALKANPAYKGIDIDRELAKMDAWLMTHPRRKKTKRFIVNWLNKIDTPVEIAPQETTEEKDRRLDAVLQKLDKEKRKKLAELTKKIGNIEEGR